MRTLFGAALLGSLALSGMPARAQPQVAITPDETLLEVRTTGQAFVRPDRAGFSIGVVSTGTTAREATDANSRAIAAVIAGLRGAQVEPRDIRTRQISVQPRFARENGGGYGGEAARISGYVAQNSVQVTTRDLARAPEIVATAFEAGANSVQGPSFTVEDRGEAIAAARADALAKARAEAEAYAAGLGMRIARTLRVSERGRSTAVSDIVVSSARMSAGAPPPPPPPPPPAPIEAGELTQTLELWIDYTLVPR